MISVVSKVPPADMYREVVCKRCGWTHSYIPLRDAVKAIYTDIAGCDEVWYYITCLNELCYDPDRQDGKTKIEVKAP